MVNNKTMTGTPHHPPSLAYSQATGLAFGVVPYAYTGDSPTPHTHLLRTLEASLLRITP